MRLTIPHEDKLYLLQVPPTCLLVHAGCELNVLVVLAAATPVVSAGAANRPNGHHLLVIAVVRVVRMLQEALNTYASLQRPVVGP